jgi:hypothetical protein
MVDLSLSSSAYRDASNCLKRYEYRWLDNLVPAPKDQAPALRRGIWLHRTLEMFDRGQDWADELARMADWAVNQGVDDQKVAELAAEVSDITRQYIAFWGERWQENQWFTEDTERVVEYSPTPGVRLTATIDVLKRDKLGRLWIWERKTLAEIPDSDWRCVDPQTMLQVVLLRTQEPVIGVVFDYVCTKSPPKLRVKKGGLVYAGDDERQTTALRLAEALPEIRAKWAPNLDFDSPEAYVAWLHGRVVADGLWFQRYPTLRDNDHLVENMRDVADTVRNVLAAERRDHYPRAWNNFTCPRFCPYIKLCANEYQIGRQNPVMRETNFVQATQDQWDQGRSA